MLGLGSNLGDRAANLRAALRELGRLGYLRRVSSFYLSEPLGFARQPRFFNAVAEIVWPGAPAALLSAVKKIERRLGRASTFRHGPRSIDIDILDFQGRVSARPDPILPHPGLTARRFVLAPLAEIAPRWRHPVTGLKAKEMLAKLPPKPWVRRLARSVIGSRSSVVGSRSW